MNKVKACIFIISLFILIILPITFVSGEREKRTYTYATKDDKPALVDKESDDESYTKKETTSQGGQKGQTVDPPQQSELPRETKIGQETVIREKGDEEAYEEKSLPEIRIDEKTGREIKIISSDEIPLTSEYRMKEEVEE